MRKNIESLMSRLTANKDGTISGGFGSIRGGFNPFASPTDNAECCGTNSNGCVNSGDCSGSTNKVIKCSNTGNCS
ncbi:hypothetical protein F0L74_20595 [Chitinophaga agrisoli]|uniref:Uncharacterized protein n=1 Tax=Chitinophaga agrisoli TaxID=2607653 RepID=A0A5B2VJB5_9BACT|nr:hypothetical protein [Chitinophaga agrisoli]KAA2238626.1 hypothetical protein F0L74_20595 [Chitinophaga agrisoli]